VLGLRALLGSCKKPEETEPCTGQQQSRGKQTLGSRRPETTCWASKAPGLLPTESTEYSLA